MNLTDMTTRRTGGSPSAGAARAVETARRLLWTFVERTRGSRHPTAPGPRPSKAHATADGAPDFDDTMPGWHHR